MTNNSTRNDTIKFFSYNMAFLLLILFLFALTPSIYNYLSLLHSNLYYSKFMESVSSYNIMPNMLIASCCLVLLSTMAFMSININVNDHMEEYKKYRTFTFILYQTFIAFSAYIIGLFILSNMDAEIFNGNDAIINVQKIVYTFVLIEIFASIWFSILSSVSGIFIKILSSVSGIFIKIKNI